MLLIVIAIGVTVIFSDCLFYTIAVLSFDTTSKDRHLGWLPLGGIWLFIKYMKTSQSST